MCALQVLLLLLLLLVGPSHLLQLREGVRPGVSGSVTIFNYVGCTKKGRSTHPR